ncbi:hypothetical protein [Neorhizobium tomejilense]|nr:hypothetical protein [Neorhizobium tomejilense]
MDAFTVSDLIKYVMSMAAWYLLAAYGAYIGVCFVIDGVKGAVDALRHY